MLALGKGLLVMLICSVVVIVIIIGIMFIGACCRFVWDLFAKSGYDFGDYFHDGYLPQRGLSFSIGAIFLMVLAAAYILGRYMI